MGLPSKLRMTIATITLLLPALASLPLSFPPTDDLRTAIHNPNLSLENKYRIKINPFLYDYFQFIKSNTPENAIIQIPPQANPWPFTGNGGFVRFFLYPRTLTGHAKSFPRLIPESEYVLLDWGETNLSTAVSGYPYFKVPAEKIIYFFPPGKNTVSNTPFDPQDPRFKSSWGIIKVAK